MTLQSLCCRPLTRGKKLPLNNDVDEVIEIVDIVDVAPLLSLVTWRLKKIGVFSLYFP
jgi:hypothetical protein